MQGIARLRPVPLLAFLSPSSVLAPTVTWLTAHLLQLFAQKPPSQGELPLATCLPPIGALDLLILLYFFHSLPSNTLSILLSMFLLTVFNPY